MTRVAINGFGRIGRALARILLEKSNIQLVAINDLADIKVMTHLFKYDSVHRTFKGEVNHSTDEIIINNKPIRFISEANVENLPWKELKVDVVVDCTGKYKSHDLAGLHLKSGAQKVIISAPPTSSDVKTVVLGINDHILEKDDIIISNASCTTNSVAPLVKVIDEICGIESAYITTVHSYTGDQRIHDAPHSDLRRSRAAAQSIIPTTTGAAKAITKIFPHLDGKMGGCGIRVPVPDGSLTDLNCIVKKSVSITELNKAFKENAEGRLKGILEYTDEPIVSSDIIGNPHSCIFDALLTSVIGSMVKVVGWYDNEIGYSNRLADLIEKIS